MKRIISVLVAVCMLCAISVMFTTTSATTLNQARTAGYGVWHNDNVEVFFANATVATRAKNASYKGIALARNMGLDWQNPPSSGEPLQLSGDISVDGTKGSFTLHAGHGCNVADVFEGRKIFIDKPFTQYASERGDEITLRLEGNDGEYYCYYLPIYKEGEVPAFDEFVITNVEFQDASKKNFYVTFSGETDNIWDANSERGDETKGVTRYCAVRIVKDTVEYELCWDGEVGKGTPAQWSCGLNGYCGNWPCKKMWTGDIEFGALGCNSFDDICNLVKPGGKFEGCVVTYCIEENGAAGNPPVAGDGKIYSIFANGDYMNMALKCSYKTLSNARYDGAYFVLYNPNPATADMTGVAVACAVLSAAAAAVVFARKKH